MENNGFNYNKYPKNYNMLVNSVSEMQQKYINNTMPNAYQLYDIKTYYNRKPIQRNYKTIRYPQAILYGNDLNLLNMQNDEDFYVSYSEGIKKNIQKVPKDTFKIPKDSTKNKQNYAEINNYAHIKTNNKYNNITTINNNNYNKINSINIIFDANNIYGDDYINYNNFNDIELLENNYNKTINNENDSKKESIFEKQPLDNYKKYTNSVNQMNNIINNDTLIKLKKSHVNDIFDKDNSYCMPGEQNNYHKSNGNNKPTNENNIIDNKANTIQNIKEERKESKLNGNIEFSNKNSLNKNSINKIEKLNSNKNSITNIKIKEMRINKKLVSPQSDKNIRNILNSHKSINNDKTKEKEKERKNENINRSNRLKQIKSYVDENKYAFLKRKNTYQKDELNKNFTFNSSLKNTKSKEKEKSNFAFLINKKKKKMFSSINQINTFTNRYSYKDDKSNYLSNQKNDIIYEKERNMKGIQKYKHKTNNLEALYKSSKSKLINNNQSYKRLYTPQVSNNNTIKKKTKKINDNKNLNFYKKKNKELTRNVSYNISFNSKKKNIFKKKIDLSTTNTFTIHSSRKRIDIKFQCINKIKDSLLENKINEKPFSSILLKTENKEGNFVNPLFSDKISKVNKCDKNVLKLSERNINKVFGQKTSDYHLKKGHINKDKNGHSKNVKSKKSYTNGNSINTHKTSKNYLSVRNSNEKKNFNKIDFKDNKITKMGKKDLFYSKNKCRSNSGILNQKKNLYSFNKRSHKKNLINRYDVFSEDKKDQYNHSFRGFSGFKKLEEIKKKYKFRPQTKEKKISLKERNINYIEESKGFAKFISFTNLEEENNSWEKDENNSKDNKNNDKNNDLNNNDQKNEKSDIEKENDIINNKSFILDLNNVIPINEKELIDTVNKISITNNSIESDKFKTDLNNIDLINNDIYKEKNKNEKTEDCI